MEIWKYRHPKPSNIGIQKNLSTTYPRKILVQEYPKLPTDIEIYDVQSDISALLILHQPAITFEIYLPPIDWSKVILEIQTVDETTKSLIGAK